MPRPLINALNDMFLIIAGLIVVAYAALILLMLGDKDAAHAVSFYGTVAFVVLPLIGIKLCPRLTRKAVSSDWLVSIIMLAKRGQRR